MWLRSQLVVLRGHLRRGLTLVHFSAHLKRFVWDRGCNQGLFEGF